MRRPLIVCLILIMAGLAACTRSKEPHAGGPDNCAIGDGALADASFVIVTRPDAGDRVASGFQVTGCSRTFESTVNWRLLARDGSELNSGFTQGGGVDGPGTFSFQVTFTGAEREIGHLEVFDEDTSDGEGPPPGRTVLPLVLLP